MKLTSTLLTCRVSNVSIGYTALTSGPYSKQHLAQNAAIARKVSFTTLKAEIPPIRIQTWCPAVLRMFMNRAAAHRLCLGVINSTQKLTHLQRVCLWSMAAQCLHPHNRLTNKDSSSFLLAAGEWTCLHQGTTWPYGQFSTCSLPVGFSNFINFSITSW